MLTNGYKFQPMLRNVNKRSQLLPNLMLTNGTNFLAMLRNANICVQILNRCYHMITNVNKHSKNLIEVINN